MEEGFAAERPGYNLNYTMSGDLDIAPINAWDNNEATYVKFPGTATSPRSTWSMPMAMKASSIAPSSARANDIVVLHKNAKWILRLGNRALAVWNEAYDPNGVRNTTGTASPAVKR